MKKYIGIFFATVAFACLLTGCGKENKTNEQVNESAMDLMLKYEIITPSSARKLIDKNKVSVSDDSFIDKYQ